MPDRLTLIASVLLFASSLSPSASAATVIYSLDLSVSSKFTLRAQTNVGDSAGLAAYDVPLLGNVLTLDQRSPVGTSAANFSPLGFNSSCSADLPSGGVNPQIIATQDTAGVIENLIYGLGQTAEQLRRQRLYKPWCGRRLA